MDYLLNRSGFLRTSPGTCWRKATGLSQPYDARANRWAAGVFFHHGRQAFYKFGASDYAFQRFRPNNTLLWEAIKRCVDNGFETLHLGRTSLANEGLRRFKLGFGAREERIEYYKYDFVGQTFVRQIDHSTAYFRPLFRCMPLPVLRFAGEMLYPHLS